MCLILFWRDHLNLSSFFKKLFSNSLISTDVFCFICVLQGVEIGKLKGLCLRKALSLLFLCQAPFPHVLYFTSHLHKRKKPCSHSGGWGQIVGHSLRFILGSHIPENILEQSSVNPGANTLSFSDVWNNIYCPPTLTLIRTSPRFLKEHLLRTPFQYKLLTPHDGETRFSFSRVSKTLCLLYSVTSPSQ